MAYMLPFPSASDDDLLPEPGNPDFLMSSQQAPVSNSGIYQQETPNSRTYVHPNQLQTPTPVNFPNPYPYPVGYQPSPNPGYPPYSHYYYPGYGHPLGPLQDTRSTTLNAPPPPSTPTLTASRKRKNATMQRAPGKHAKRPRTSATSTMLSSSGAQDASSSVPTAAVHCGVGPSQVPSVSSTPPSSTAAGSESRPPPPTSSDATTPSMTIPTSATPPPLHSYSAATEEATNHHDHDASKAVATDVWYFLCALNTNKEPTVQPNEETEPILTKNPTGSKFVGCKLCKKWKTWTHGTGMTTCYRIHMKNHHFKVYEATVQELGLKNSASSLPGSRSIPDCGPFSLPTFYHLLMKWIAVDDQSMNIVKCPEFRELLLYIGNDTVNDNNVPHRTKITQMIFKEHMAMRQQIMAELRKAVGRISYTLDLWSDPNLISYMAVTAHFYIRENGHLVLRTYLVAFRHVSGSHSGANLARYFFEIVDELGVGHQVGLVTMDNASNNNTMMEELEEIFRNRGIPFDADGNRIRCFPHIINLACQAILEALKQSPALGLSSATDTATKIYLQSLETDLIGTCRSVVAACRASGQHCQELRRIICDGNEKKAWDGELPAGETHLRVLQLLRDCETRWSSTYLMIDRIIYLYPAVRKFLNNVEQTDLSHYLFSNQQLNILRDIHQVLEVPHTAQELLSAERTPTLSLSLPLYEILIEQWKLLQATILELAPYIEVGIQKLEDYVGKARKTRIYARTMVLNPCMKFDWMEKHWGNKDTNQACEWIKESMLRYQQSLRRQDVTRPRPAPLDRTMSTPSIAARSQGLGFARLSGINVAVRHSTSMSTTPSQSLPSPTPPSSHASERVPTLEEVRIQEARELLEDQHAVDQELKCYEDDGVAPTSERMSDLTRHWEQHEHSYPLLFCVAMDVLPAQASAVPCERVFSSSTETCSLRRNKLSPKLMEALQMLKFSYKQERLSFTDDLLAREEDYTITGPVSSAAVVELVRTGRVCELDKLLANTEA